MLDGLGLSADGDTLVIRGKRETYFKTEGLTLTLQTDGLKALELNSFAELSADAPIQADSFALISRSVARGTLPVDCGALSVSSIVSSELKITGSAKTLDLSLKAAGSIDTGALSADEVRVTITGAGWVRTAAAQSLSVTCDGIGEVLAADSPTQRATVTINGAGKATVWVEETLDATINGAGMIRYKGSPEVHRRIQGIGSVAVMGE